MSEALRFERTDETLPPGFEVLRAEAEAEGHELLNRFVAALASGAERYDGRTAHFLAVWRGETLVALGGIAPDRYLADPKVGRLRHVYVARAERRNGVGARLVAELLRLGEPFDRVRLRTVTEAAARFYEALGFERTRDPDATHIIDRSRALPTGRPSTLPPRTLLPSDTV